MKQEGRQGTLTQRTIGGMLWMAVGRSSNGVLQVLILAALARLLSPSDFGVVSAALVVIALSEIMSQLGIGPALVQRPEIEPRHIETAFASSVLLGLSLGTLVWWAAPGVAAFFHIGGVTPVLRTLAWVFALRGVGVAAESLLRRELQFRWLAMLDVV